MYDEHWLQWEWEGSRADQQITIKELVPIVAACNVWGSEWQDKHVVVMCDNMAVVQVVTALSSKDPTIRHLLKCTYFYLASFNIQIKAKHVVGVQNIITCRRSESWPD